MDNYPVELKSGSRRNLIAAVKRSMKWAEEQGYIERSPIAHMKKPGCGRQANIYLLLKRTLDFLLAGAFSLLAAPLVLLFAAIIR